MLFEATFPSSSSSSSNAFRELYCTVRVHHHGRVAHAVVAVEVVMAVINDMSSLDRTVFITCRFHYASRSGRPERDGAITCIYKWRAFSRILVAKADSQEFSISLCLCVWTTTD